MNLTSRLLAESPGLCLLWAGLLVLWMSATLVGTRFVTKLWQRGRARLATHGIRSLLSGEAGASYALPVVMTIPIYLLTCLCFAETTLILATKLGTIYAAYAGARSTAVWDWIDEESRDDRLRQSVLTALGGFVASGHERGGQAGEPQWEISEHTADYVIALEMLSGRDVDESRLETHLARVAARTSIELEIPERTMHEPVSVTVTYRAPFIFAGVARFFDPDRQPPYELPCRSTVTLALERPITETGRLGIDYRAF